MEDQGATSSQDEHHRYAGQEFVDQLDYDLIHYKARWYDPSIGRFGTVDPLSGSMPSYSPYVYVFNNPISFTDPTVMVGECLLCGGSSTSYQGSTSSNEAFQSMKDGFQLEVQAARNRRNVDNFLSNACKWVSTVGAEVSRSTESGYLRIHYEGGLRLKARAGF